MSDRLSREFRAQLTSTMDSVIRRAMFEIMKIFENSLYDHQMELAQKGEEIAQLKLKMQRTELKLKESESGGKREENKNTTQVNQSEREPEGVVNAPEQSSEVPEIDFEVPDDWCAPLGCEAVAKQEDVVCPSVRLRQLYIPLSHIPVKQEVLNHAIQSQQQTMDGRKTRSGSSLKEKYKQTQDRTSSIPNKKTQRPPVRSDIKRLLQDIKQPQVDLTDRPMVLRRGKSKGKEQERMMKNKIEEETIPATESKSTEQEMVENDGERRYSCKFCKKEFDTLFGRSVHVRTHKRCRGCKREFPFPSSLKNHKPHCAKLQKLLSNVALTTNLPKPQSCDEEKPAAPSEKQMALEENTPSSSLIESSQKDEPAKKHSCLYCNKKFGTHFRKKEHMRIHTGEKPFSCSMCPKKFRTNQTLKLHITRVHKDKVDPSLTNGSLWWTMPVEVMEDNELDLITPSDPIHESTTTNSSDPPQQSPASPVHCYNEVQNKDNSDTKWVSRWNTMGIRCTEGFSCFLCQKVTKNKHTLIEHFRRHTGEKPLQCDFCGSKFRYRGQLSMHKKKCCKSVFQCEKCDKKFPSQQKYDKHLHTYHKNWSHFCSVCGKGFVVEGRLRNHMESHKCKPENSEH